MRSSWRRGVLALIVALALVALVIWQHRRASAPDSTAASIRTAVRAIRALPPLAPPARGLLTGTVRRESGEPLATARVCATCASCEAMVTTAHACVDADDRGAFHISDLAAMGYHVAASAPGFAPGLAEGGRPVFVTKDAPRSVEIVLARGGAELSGLVLDALGGPIVGAEVRAVQWTTPIRALTVTSDREGRFELALAPGATTLLATADGYGQAKHACVAPTRGVELVLSPASSLAGTIVSAADGQPIAGARVYAQRLGDAMSATPRTVESGREGRFHIGNLEAGDYGIEASGPGFRGRSERTVALGIADAIGGVIVRVSAAAAVSGRVVIGASGAACSAGTVVLGPPAPFAIPAFSAAAKQALMATAAARQGPVATLFATIDAGGEVRFDGVPAGQYFATVQCADHTLREGPDLIAVQNEDIAGLTWRVERGLALAIRVVDERRQPVPGAAFALEFPGLQPGVSGPKMGLTADAEGRYETPSSLYPGHYRVHPMDAAAGDPAEVMLADKTSRAEVELRLRGSGAIVANVHSQQGEPVDGVHVYAHELDAQGGEAAATATPSSGLQAAALGAGEYRIGPLRPGRYRVQVSDGLNPEIAIDRGGSTAIRVEGGETARVGVVLPREQAIRGRVVDEHGEPLATVWVTAERDEIDARTFAFAAIRRAQSTGRVLTDDEGRFTLARLAAGSRFTVKAEQPGSGSALQRGVQAGSEIEIELRP